MTFLQEYRRERAVIDAKIRAAGIDPAAIVWRARLRNWLQDVRHTVKNMVLYYRTGLVETTTATDVYATYAPEKALQDAIEAVEQGYARPCASD